jgi:hypothetical protein
LRRSYTQSDFDINEGKVRAHTFKKRCDDDGEGWSHGKSRMPSLCGYAQKIIMTLCFGVGGAPTSPRLVKLGEGKTLPPISMYGLDLSVLPARTGGLIWRWYIVLVALFGWGFLV